MPWFAKYDGVDGDVSSSKVTDGTSNTLMIAEQHPTSDGATRFDGAYVVTSVSHTATLDAPESDWLVS